MNYARIRGLGSFIVTRLFKHSLSGEVTQDFAPEGVPHAAEAAEMSANPKPHN